MSSAMTSRTETQTLTQTQVEKLGYLTKTTRIEFN